MEAQEKRAWEEPELIVLVRGRPEEAVLADCKNETGGPFATPCMSELSNCHDMIPS